jgi:hypothetical protein
VPGKVREGGVDLGELGGGDQEGEASGGGEERGGYGEDVGEAFDGAEGDYVEGGGGRVSARTFCISMSVNVRARVSSRRKVAFF